MERRCQFEMKGGRVLLQDRFFWIGLIRSVDELIESYSRCPNEKKISS